MTWTTRARDAFVSEVETKPNHGRFADAPMRAYDIARFLNLREYRNRDKVDFLVRNHGTVWTIVPQTEAAKEWTAENVEIEDWQRMGSGSGFTGDHRPMRHLVEAIEAEGFSVERG
jgi:hypothetical protein